MPGDAYLPAIQPVRKGHRVLIIGDSHTVGPFGEELDRRLRAAGAEVATYGSCGSAPATWRTGTPTRCGYFARQRDGTTDRPPWREPHATPLLNDLLQQESPDVVIVALGANLEGSSPGYIKASAGRLLKTITDAGARCIWVGPPNARPGVVKPGVREATVAALRDAVSGKTTFIDSRQFTHYPDRGGDGRHFGGREGTRIAREWADSVAALIIGTVHPTR